MKKKIALVLEGGGMRGAYTAGALSWLIDEGIEFDNAYGISTGAIHLCSFLMKNKKFLKDTSTRYIADKKLIGLPSYLKEGQIVAYDTLFQKTLIEKLHYDQGLKKIQEEKLSAKIGIYDLDKCETEYVPLSDLNMNILKAACTLPAIGKVVKEKDRKLLDGGITKMIPIEESVKDGNDAHIIITTKPDGYVRKPAKSIVVFLMSLIYLKHPQIGKDYKNRHLNYNEQIRMITSLQKEGKAIYRNPSKTSSVSRLGGTPEQLDELYQLGYQDMEAIREEIYALIHD